MVNLNYNWLYLQLILFANFTDNDKVKNIYVMPNLLML
jgi:hypothetical protein